MKMVNGQDGKNLEDPTLESCEMRSICIKLRISEKLLFSKSLKSGVYLLMQHRLTCHA